MSACCGASTHPRKREWSNILRCCTPPQLMLQLMLNMKAVVKAGSGQQRAGVAAPLAPCQPAGDKRQAVCYKSRYGLREACAQPVSRPRPGLAMHICARQPTPTDGGQQ